ncbi:S-layer homology domain-containing protein [Candidatus Saganbacteria bacterium]|nr:S-layer homology domain-containing protein [Candidatus Saganbacteria bacterium]
MKKKLLLFFGLWLALAGLVLAAAAPDPIRIATGARPLGMGKAFVGLADDLGSIFLNPAGLGNPERWQLTSMSGKLLEEFNYLSFSGLYPTQYGNFGIAYIGSSVGGAIPTTIEAGSSASDPIYTVDLSGDGAMSYYNNLFILSYGAKLEKIPGLGKLLTKSFPRLTGINVGANLKFFSVNLTGDHITNGSGSGNELDIGVQGKPLGWLSLGANIQNALPTSMGGKLHFNSGWEEAYPAVLKSGLAAAIIGVDNSLMKLGGHKVNVLADVDYELTRSSTIPPLLHLGVEWKPIELLAIRAGIDQEMAGASETSNNFTSGVGLNYGDFRFDYAFHQFTGAPGVENHFFSLSYGIAPVKKFTEQIIATPDKLITTETAVDIKGTAVDYAIKGIKINGLKVQTTPRGEFTLTVSLPVGKNAILIEGLDTQGKVIASKKLRVLRLLTYPDVAGNHWAAEQISYIGTLGIIKGYPNGVFKPEGNITRAELSALLVRTKLGSDQNVPAAGKQKFRDVGLAHWAVKYINAAATDSIVTGYPDKTFKPAANISRAEGLSMVARFGRVKQIPYTSEFTDIKATHWAATLLAGAKKEGLLAFLANQPFSPNKKLVRSEAVEILFRSQPVKAIIADLMNFDKGY